MSLDFEMLRPTIGLLEKSYSIGDIFNREVYLGLQTMYRSWHVRIPSSNMGRREIGCKIGFRFGQITGSWVLIVNGEVKAVYKGRISDGPFDLMFKICEQNFTITAERLKPIKFTMKLRMNGYEIMEIRKTTEIAVGEMVPTRVTVVDKRRCFIDGKPVIMYRLCSEINSKEKVLVERRYSDFEMLSNMVRGQTSKHLRTTLPGLPGKVLNPFFDQNKVAFLDQRQQALQLYLTNLLANSKVCLYSEVFCFLGLDPITGQPLEVLPVVDGAAAAMIHDAEGGGGADSSSFSRSRYYSSARDDSFISVKVGGDDDDDDDD